mmetsp:Transcript_41883/g.107173  ORF Transcript_41883/g.107173 Transcript_41883/m.107173 type:complete len:349 (-) Transcript_41883:953-1999(-)
MYFWMWMEKAGSRLFHTAKGLDQRLHALRLRRQPLPDVGLPDAPGPVALRPARGVHAAVHVVQPHHVLDEHDGALAHARHGRLDEHPVDAGAIRPDVACTKVGGQVLLGRITRRVAVPANGGLVVMRARVAEGVLVVHVWQVRVAGAALPSKLEHNHARRCNTLSQLHHIACDHSQILRHDRHLAHLALQRGKQLLPRALLPGSAHRCLRRTLDGPVPCKRAEVVDAALVVQVKGACQPFRPPRVVLSSVLLPVIQRGAPQLAGLTEGIRRHTAHQARLLVVVQHEQARVGPHIRRVPSDVDGHVTQQRNIFRVGVCLERLPLLVKQELQRNIDIDILLVLGGHLCDR